MYKFLNVDITSSDDIIYNSTTGPSMGEVATPWGLVPRVFSRLFINKQYISLLATKHIFVVPKEDLFLSKEERSSLLMNPFTFVHFNLPHTMPNYVWHSLHIGFKKHCEGWHLTCMTTKGPVNFVRVVT